MENNENHENHQNSEDNSLTKIYKLIDENSIYDLIPSYYDEKNFKIATQAETMALKMQEENNLKDAAELYYIAAIHHRINKYYYYTTTSYKKAINLYKICNDNENAVIITREFEDFNKKNFLPNIKMEE
jgi:hypothetical protein